MLFAPHFTEEETEVQKGQGTCLKSPESLCSYVAHPVTPGSVGDREQNCTEREVDRALVLGVSMAQHPVAL